MWYSIHTDFFSIHANVYAQQSWKRTCKVLTHLRKQSVYLLRNDDLYSIFTFEFDLKSINQEFVVS